jgi:copper chaperone
MFIFAMPFYQNPFSFNLKMKHQFKTNINCGNCIRSVTPALNALPEIEHWEVDTDNPDKILTVELDEDGTPAMVIEALESVGFQASNKI